MFNLSNIQKAIIALIITNIIWGSSAPLMKWALEDISPFTLAFLRFALSSVILLPFIRINKLKIERRDWPKLFMLAFVGIFLHISFFFLGLEISSSINVPVIASAGPIFLMILSIYILKEHPGQKKITGGMVSLLGVAIIVLLPILGAGTSLDSSILGNLFFVIATVSGVAHTIILKNLASKYDHLPLLFWTFLIASLMFFPMFFNEFSQGSLENIGLPGAFGIIYSTIFISTIAYLFYYWALKYIMASEAGIFTYLGPVVAILIAGPLLGERPTFEYLLGSILVFLGIYIAEVKIHYHPMHLFRR